MTLEETKSLRVGDRVVYNDGRGDAVAVILSIGTGGMVVQFEDRYSSSTIFWGEKDWMNFLRAL